MKHGTFSLKVISLRLEYSNCKQVYGGGFSIQHLYYDLVPNQYFECYIVGCKAW